MEAILSVDTMVSGGWTWVCCQIKTVLVEKKKKKGETLKPTLWTTHIHLLLTLSSHYPGIANPRFWLVTISEKELLLQLVLNTNNVIMSSHLDFPHPHPQSAILMGQLGCQVGWALMLEGCDPLIPCLSHNAIMFPSTYSDRHKSTKIHSSEPLACQAFFSCS